MKIVILKIGKTMVPALLTETEEEQSRGLMYHEAPTPVMIFSYDKPKINMFWMKNTPAPLDIIFCKDNKVIDIKQGMPYSEKIISNYSLSDLIIEMPFGSCKDRNIGYSTTVEIIEKK